MTIKSSEAAQLCTQAELQLVRASMTRSIGKLSAPELRRKISRTRTLRDKFRDLAKRQRLEARGKRDSNRSRTATDNARTKRKAELFSETLARFQKRLDVVEGQMAKDAAAREATKKQAAKKSAAPKKAAKKKATTKKSAKKAATKKSVKQSASSSASAVDAISGVTSRRTRREALSSITAAKNARFTKGPQTNIQAHTRSANSRAQARRDHR